MLSKSKKNKNRPFHTCVLLYLLNLNPVFATLRQILSNPIPMADPSSQNPNLATPPPPSSPSPTHQIQSGTSELSPPSRPPCSTLSFLKTANRPKLRVTSEFDSDSLLFLNKVSCKLFDNLAKLKLSFQNNSQREISQPQVSFTSKHVSVLYDVEEKNTFIKSTLDVHPRLQLRALHNVKVHISTSS